MRICFLPRRRFDAAVMRGNWFLVALIFFIRLPDLTRDGAGVNLKPVVTAGMSRGLNGTGSTEPWSVSPEFRAPLAFQALAADCWCRDGLEQREVGGPGGRSGQEPVVVARMEPAPGPSFNGSLLKREPAQERFCRVGGVEEKEPGGWRGQAGAMGSPGRPKP